MIILTSAETEVPQTGRRAAIVTIVIGAEYQATWARLCQDSWRQYAQTFDLDLIVISAPLDTSERAAARSPAWQKLLILNQPWAKRYERIIWLDSDIIIAPQAPDILTACGPAEKVSLTLSGGRSSDAERMLFLERLHRQMLKPEAERRVWVRDTHKSYARHGVPQHDIMFNTGVLVVSPQHHNELFLHCYEGEQKARLYEQPLLSHEIIHRDLTHLISARFNWGLQEVLFLYVPEIIDLDKRSPELFEPVLQLAKYFVRRELASGYFLHFYGSMNLMKILEYDDVFGGDALEMYVTKDG